MKLIKTMLIILVCSSCKEPTTDKKPLQPIATINTSLVILGTIQDAGSPQIACKKECCKALFEHPAPNRKIVCLGLIDQDKKYLLEATPDIISQMKHLKIVSNSSIETPDGIFLTHAHIGHYTGLMYLGKEAMNADHIPVYAMPKMKSFLEQNGPWSQLVSNNNIIIHRLNDQQQKVLSPNLSITPFTVPHRDEFSETVGYQIDGPNKSALFIPDIDKWEKWETDIVETLSHVDYAFLDATFYDGIEINNRDISEIPHPFIVESIDKFKDLSPIEKSKIYFIHFNHTNPVLNENSEACQKIVSNGFNLARINDIIEL